MTLPADVFRCRGMTDITAQAMPCSRRETCLRYQAFQRLDRAAGIQHYFRIPLIIGMPDCEHYRPSTPAAHKSA